MKTAMQVAADLIVDATIAKLAEVHDTTPDVISIGLAHGHERLVDQFMTLTQDAVLAAVELHEAGRIGLT